jgi:hypothetical protein
VKIIDPQSKHMSLDIDGNTVHVLGHNSLSNEGEYVVRLQGPGGFECAFEEADRPNTLMLAAAFFGVLATKLRDQAIDDGYLPSIPTRGGRA